MLQRIKQDLSQDLNCQPEEIILVDERSVRGETVRYFRYQNLGFKISTNFRDEEYTNIEPYDPARPLPPTSMNDLIVPNDIMSAELNRQLQEMRAAARTPGRVVDATNLENSTESVVEALGLEGYRRAGRVNFRDYTLRVFIEGNFAEDDDDFEGGGGCYLTAQNAAVIKDLTNFGTTIQGDWNDRLKEFSQGRLNGNPHTAAAVFQEFINQNSEEFVFACLSEIILRNPQAALRPILQDIEKLFHTDRVQVSGDHREVEIYPNNPCNNVRFSSFRVAFMTETLNPGDYWGIEIVTD